MRITSLASAIFVFAATNSLAQETTYTLLGTPGLVEMPTARSAPDAEVSIGISAWRLQQKSNFTFQITPRLTGAFRYAGIDERKGPGTDGTYDRSFDLRYRILDETKYRPAVAIGFQDFLGTGLLSGEYIVATKAVTPSLDITAGLGWGRLGSRDPIGSPFGSRPSRDYGVGGEIESDQFFKGDMAIFGGLDYRVSERLSFQVEYSSDAYERETGNGSLDVNSPINVGLNYRPLPGIALNAAYLYGSELAGGVTIYLNPNDRQNPSGMETAPQPIIPRTSVAATSWSSQSEANLVRALSEEGIVLEATEIHGNTARVRFDNTRYRSEAQAMGRTARILSATLPSEITTLVLEPTNNGIPLSSTTINRDTLESLENTANAAEALRASISIDDAGSNRGLTPTPNAQSNFAWGISPYLSLLVFNGDAPVQADVGLEFSAEYNIRPNLTLAGTVRQSLLGERDIAEITEVVNDYPNVRTDSRYFGVDGTPVLTDLTLSHYSRLGPNTYARLSAGYFETMYGGAAAEVLWKPVNSKFALGTEVVYARLRDFDVGLGFQDFETTTAHVSAYYDFDNGFHGQIDVGRYLAGDTGATISLDRVFENGWKVGGYFSITDMSFEDFGEGSFDKGIRMTVPTDFFVGKPTQRSISPAFSSLTRDGAARVQMDGRLYEQVRTGHEAGGLGDTWGRFWR